MKRSVILLAAALSLSLAPGCGATGTSKGDPSRKTGDALATGDKASQPQPGDARSEGAEPNDAEAGELGSARTGSGTARAENGGEPAPVVYELPAAGPEVTALREQGWKPVELLAARLEKADGSWRLEADVRVPEGKWQVLVVQRLPEDAIAEEFEVLGRLEQAAPPAPGQIDLVGPAIAGVECEAELTDAAVMVIVHGRDGSMEQVEVER